MDESTRGSARPLALVAALLLLVLSIGVTGSAFADPGAGKGNAQANGQGGVGVVDTSGVPAAQPSGGSDHSKGNASTKGSYKEPQPQSNADQHSGGANGQCPGGPYCSTRDGSPSGNGNGGGKAVGKPCAGCVGKADNKNPKGQRPGGSDHNAGYECDRNHGIGRTNPAHTGCVTPPPGCETTSSCPPQPGCEANPSKCPPPPGCEATPSKCPAPPPVCDATMTRCVPPTCASDASLCTPGPACTEGSCARVPGANRAPTVLGTEASRSPRGGKALVGPAVVAPAAAPAVGPATGARPSAGTLPATGAGRGLGLIGLGGLALVLVGAVTMRLRRAGER